VSSYLIDSKFSSPKNNNKMGKFRLARRQSPESNTTVVWWERVLAALIAPVVFNASLLILFGLFFRKRYWLQSHLTLPVAVWIVLLTVPAAVGFLLGFNRLVWLIGHSFWTHLSHERDRRITISIWACLGLCAFAVSQAWG
jgi:hypothetical protein